jgi:tyrosinase
MPLRRDILALSVVDVQQFTAALNTLKTNGTYNRLVERHHQAMPYAHRKSTFFPLHRAWLLELEAALLAVDPYCPALPYWNWANDQARPGGPLTSPLWTDAYLGPDGDPLQGNRVLSGPFKDWHAHIYDARTGGYVDRATVGLVRQLGRDTVTALPTTSTEQSLLGRTPYDLAPWNWDTTTGFRKLTEVQHGRVHNWCSGDMLPGTSPNDPLFWLVHCNFDRIWYLWQHQHGVDSYLPTSGGPVGTNIDDTLQFAVPARTIRSVLNCADLNVTYE